MVIAIGGKTGTATQSQGPNFRLQSQSNNRLRGIAFAAIVGSCSVAISLHKRQSKSLATSSTNVSRLKPRLNNLTVDAICGAVGEIAALVALYPLDTLKVQCQSKQQSFWHTLRSLASRPPHELIKTVYAGVGSAAVGAGIVGSLYLVAFYGAKRIGEEAAAKSNVSNAHALVASAAGVAASLVGSLVESPVEHFKVRTQISGGVGGPMHVAMLNTVTQSGFGNLYYSLLPFLLKSIPHDVAELVTFSAFNDLRAEGKSHLNNGDSSSSSSSMLMVADNQQHRKTTQQQIAQALSTLPVGVGDMLIGAIAGAAAAAASMPCDVIFTQMNLKSACIVAGHSGRPTLKESAALFIRTGQALVRHGGSGALFYGFAPRLLQTVPAGVIYWCAVEATRRALQRNFNVQHGNASTTLEVMQAEELTDASLSLQTA